MDTWLDECNFRKIETDDNSFEIEGGWEDFERIDIRSKEGHKIHIYKINKKTPAFEIEMWWAVNPEDDNLTTEEIEERAKNQLRTDGSYRAATYLEAMDLPPIQGLFYEAMIISWQIEEEEENNDSRD